jgi:hypothetical protein
MRLIFRLSSLRAIAHRLLGLTILLSAAAAAEPISAPGDMRLRHDLQLLSDSGVINVPLTGWPLSLGDIHQAVQQSDSATLDISERAALDRVRDRLSLELETSAVRYRFGVAGAYEPRGVRSFEGMPREEGEASAGLSWLGERFAVNLAATYVANPFDGEESRPDGSYVGVVLGNWIVTAGWQERWWGPSRDGSLILGSNARPAPGVALQRIISKPFESKLGSWMGPWTLMTFMTELDDDRTIRNAKLFGIRGSIRPPRTGLEFGISRTAQWCGDGRPCDAGTFVDLLLGNDNRGVNIDPADEPGNQLGGFDLRWSLPRRVPVALYMQWIGEDGRGGGGAIGSWLRQLGVEHWGTIGGLSHRTHIEVSDTMCREGGFGFSFQKPNCAYGHSIYRTGYRYRSRAAGHPGDGDTLSYSLGSTLVQSSGHVWNLSLRFMEINRVGAPDSRHTLSPTPQDLTDIQLSHERDTRFGRFVGGIGYSRIQSLATGTADSDVTAFIQWSSGLL